MTDTLTWTCHVCGDVRPDNRISVYQRHSMLAGRFPYTENVRYGNDREACISRARRPLHPEGCKRVTTIAPPIPVEVVDDDPVEGHDPDWVCHRTVGYGKTLCGYGHHGMPAEIAERKNGRCVLCGEPACPKCEAIWHDH
jgi:hypothetical protein